MDSPIIRDNLNKKSSDELLKILENDKDDYTLQSIEIIRDILRNRGVTDEIIKEAENNYKPKIVTHKKPSKIIRLLLWIISLITLMMVIYLKNEFSNGIAKNLATTNDTTKSHNFWTPELQKAAKDNILKSPLVKNMDLKYRQPFCDCFVKGIEDNYPNGIKDSINQSVKDTIAFRCAKYIKSTIK